MVGMLMCVAASGKVPAANGNFPTHGAQKVGGRPGPCKKSFFTRHHVQKFEQTTQIAIYQVIVKRSCLINHTRDPVLLLASQLPLTSGVL